MSVPVGRRPSEDDYFTALWWYFGPHGPQDVHVHEQFNEDDKSGEVLIGEGRLCERGAEHRICTLDAFHAANEEGGS
jgi:hypothetical protein